MGVEVSSAPHRYLTRFPLRDVLEETPQGNVLQTNVYTYSPIWFLSPRAPRIPFLAGEKPDRLSEKHMRGSNCNDQVSALLLAVCELDERFAASDVGLHSGGCGCGCGCVGPRTE